ncbi:unnamed protein product [Linum trigynum]|uniref:Uncharacterized protein n=1 Tax=Linum trigynum TaxID=586398 RepID=A0AAV2DXC4_9ROSI
MLPSQYSSFGEYGKVDARPPMVIFYTKRSSCGVMGYDRGTKGSEVSRSAKANIAFFHKTRFSVQVFWSALMGPQKHIKVVQLDLSASQRFPTSHH